jgi:hypothetical protein
MDTRITRRRFLTAAGAGATYLALTNMVGCELVGRASKVSPVHTPKLGSLNVPKKGPSLARRFIRA